MPLETEMKHLIERIAVYAEARHVEKEYESERRLDRISSDLLQLIVKIVNDTKLK